MRPALGRGDWIVDEETVAEPRLLPADVLAATVRRVHEAGGRVAIHATHEVACRRAVEAGVAHDAGVAVLAGTDFRPHGTIAGEVRHLAAGGLAPMTALGAACWTAREFLGLPGLGDGAPADFVVYDRDPVAGLQQLDHPAHVVLGGRLQAGTTPLAN